MNDEEVRIVKRNRDPNDVGKIRRTPGVMGSRPVIAGTRIEPEFVRSFHEVGFTTEQIIEQYTHLHPHDLDAAIAFVGKKRQPITRIRRIRSSRATPGKRPR
jgi:uncharacterized protein (DUF433 family)